MIGSMSSAAWKAWRIRLPVIRPCLWLRTAVLHASGLLRPATTPGIVFMARVRVLLIRQRGVMLARPPAGEPDRHVGHGDEQDLVQVGRATTAEPLGRVRARNVVLEACDANVPIGLVLDETVGAR